MYLSLRIIVQLYHSTDSPYARFGTYETLQFIQTFFKKKEFLLKVCCSYQIFIACMALKRHKSGRRNLKSRLCMPPQLQQYCVDANHL